MRIDGVVVGESPAWLKSRLESIGQRSINNIVDVTNFVQFALNKPLHAYDARSIKGTLRARFAKKGEMLTTLDDKELKLDTKTLMIADDEKVLGLAGIKGGKYCGIEPDTTSVIIESANFEPTLIRKTAEKYGIHTDASKRFENGIANSLVEDGLYMTANLIKKICKEAGGSEVVDVYPRIDKTFKLGISVEEVNAILGTAYDREITEKTLKALSFPYEKVVPEEKLRELVPITIDKPYYRLASTLYDAPNKFSCGSLVNWLYKEVGYPTLRVALDMYVFSKHIDKNDLKYGDFIFTNTKKEFPKDAMIYSKVLGKEIPDVPKYTKTIEFLRGTEFPSGIDHVGMYVGNEKVLHAGSMIGKVMIEDIATSDYFKNECWYGRMVDDLTIPQYVVSVPSERLDIRIKEDMAEEIARIIGYDKLVPILPRLSHIGLVPKRIHYENKIREILFANGFSEVMTYSFGREGEVSLVKGLALDKEKLRTNLGDGILTSLSLNLYNAPLLGQKTIKIFEIGNVFSNESESRHLAIAIDDGGKKSNFTESIEFVLIEIKRALGLNNLEYITSSVKPYVIEIDFDTLISSLSEPKHYEAPIFANLPAVYYKTVSPYPFIARDIAMWVPASTTWEGIHNLCNEVRNPLVTRIDLFDTFSKEVESVKKTSYAFRLVFQSDEKTLTDEEVNKMMDEYYKLFKDKGYEIR
jgi:phenylalanyl-tRNA synthetase beta subunit